MIYALVTCKDERLTILTKVAVVSFILFIVSSCDKDQIQGFVFKKLLQQTLIEKCGDKDRLCINGVKKQIDKCSEKANWRRLVKEPENEIEVERFSKIFYACLVDVKGNPLFEY